MAIIIGRNLTTKINNSTGIIKIENIAQPSSGGGSTPNYLLQENFEGSNSGGCFDLTSWTTIGTIDSCYTGTIIDGSHSLRLTNDGSGATHTFATQSEMWAYWKMIIHTAASERFAFFIQDAAGTHNLAVVSINGGTDAIKLYDGDLTHSVTVDNPFILDTVYHFWLHYKKGTGSDGVVDIGFSSDGIRPTSGGNYKEITNAAGTLDAGLVAPFNSGGVADLIYDKIRILDSVIGNNPA